jgi:hypothetical protein
MALARGNLDIVRRLVPVAGANAVPIAGVFFADWSGGTALTMYWCENLLMSSLVLVLLLLHRRGTRKRGYQRLQLSLASDPSVASSSGRPSGRSRGDRRLGHRRQPGSFVREFAVAAGAATLVHGLLLWWVIRDVLAELPFDGSLRTGLLVVAGFHLLGFGMDLVGLKGRSFAWARGRAEVGFNRVMLVHLALLIGFWVSLERGGSGFFGPFAILKAVADIGNLLHRSGLRANPDEPPRLLTAAMNRLTSKSGRDFGEHWRQRRAEEKALAKDDELEMTIQQRRR